MSDNDQSGADRTLEDAADEGQLPGLNEADLAEREGRDTSDTGDGGSAGGDPAMDGSAEDSATRDGTADDDAPAGGVVMGAINQH